MNDYYDIGLKVMDFKSLIWWYYIIMIVIFFLLVLNVKDVILFDVNGKCSRMC